MSLASLITAVVGLAAIGQPTITLSRQKQLFLDDYLIESSRNIERRIHPAEKFDGNPVL
jgi:hypothetical protein